MSSNADGAPIVTVRLPDDRGERVSLPKSNLEKMERVCTAARRKKLAELTLADADAEFDAALKALVQP